MLTTAVRRSTRVRAGHPQFHQITTLLPRTVSTALRHRVYLQAVNEVGPLQMRQNASELVRRAEAGEQATITVAGRPAALTPMRPRTWRRWDEIADVFDRSVDRNRAHDRDLVDDSLADRWDER